MHHELVNKIKYLRPSLFHFLAYLHQWKKSMIYGVMLNFYSWQLTIVFTLILQLYLGNGVTAKRSEKFNVCLNLIPLECYCQTI